MNVLRCNLSDVPLWSHGLHCRCIIILNLYFLVSHVHSLYAFYNETSFLCSNSIEPNVEDNYFL